MTSETINELVSKFTDELFYGDDMSDFQTIEERHDVWEICNSFVNFLMENYSIISKEVTNKHFIEIAKDYAMYLDPDNKPNRTMIEVDSLGFLNWVMEKYCLVEKSKLEALQDEIHGEIMCAHDDDDWQSASHYVLDVLPRSFGELYN